MIFANRKIAARHFDFKHVLLPYLWESQFTFKGANSPNLAGGSAGVKIIFRNPSTLVVELLML